MLSPRNVHVASGVLMKVVKGWAAYLSGQRCREKSGTKLLESVVGCLHERSARRQSGLTSSWQKVIESGLCPARCRTASFLPNPLHSKIHVTEIFWIAVKEPELSCHNMGM